MNYDLGFGLLLGSLGVDAIVCVYKFAVFNTGRSVSCRSLLVRHVETNAPPLEVSLKGSVGTKSYHEEFATGVHSGISLSDTKRSTFCLGIQTDFWWRRRESNPRPQRFYFNLCRGCQIT